jgi:hypothetical protein
MPEAVLLEQIDRLLAAATRFAVRHDVGARVELAQMLRQFA